MKTKSKIKLMLSRVVVRMSKASKIPFKRLRKFECLIDKYNKQTHGRIIGGLRPPWPLLSLEAPLPDAPLKFRGTCKPFVHHRDIFCWETFGLFVFV